MCLTTQSNTLWFQHKHTPQMCEGFLYNKSYQLWEDGHTYFSDLIIFKGYTGAFLCNIQRFHSNMSKYDTHWRKMLLLTVFMFELSTSWVA